MDVPSANAGPVNSPNLTPRVVRTEESQRSVRHVSNGRAVGAAVHRHVELPVEPTVPRPPAASMPLPAALPEALRRRSELQQVAADPEALAARLQAMDLDESELAELRAFAEQFVELPPDRVERSVSRIERRSVVRAPPSGSRR
jgi:hypothetical protein